MRQRDVEFGFLFGECGPVGRGSARAVARDNPKAETVSSSHGSGGASPYRPERAPIAANLDPEAARRINRHI